MQFFICKLIIILPPYTKECTSVFFNAQKFVCLRMSIRRLGRNLPEH